MEILKHKNPPAKPANYIVSCSCGCIFKFSEEEVLKAEKHIGGKKMIKCPECDTEIWFDPAICIVQDPLEMPKDVSLTQPSVSSPDNSAGCEQCSWYQTRLHDNSPYIGDTPCTFCNRGWRVTCTTAPPKANE